VDNLQTGSLANIAHLLANPNFEFVEANVTQPMDFEGIDQIYNLACPASTVQYQLDPVSTIRTNVLGAINLLDLALKNDASILQASTSEVYGDPEVHPQPETYWGRVNPIGPRSCYDEGKRAAETIFFDYLRQYQVKIKVARIFNTYGQRMDPNDGRVVSNFVVQALKGEPITVYGTGNQTRSFCYVADLVEALILLMNSPQNVTGPINLGNPEEFTMVELANRVVEFVGGESKVAFEELPIDDPQQRQPDIALAKKVLGWSPKTNLSEGLELTVEHFRKVLEIH
jgi:UDP-glucuronate decarboxylase